MEVGVREVGDDGGRRERGWIGGRERLGRAGSGSSGPERAVRAGLPDTERVGRAFVRADMVVWAGSRPCHTRRAGEFPSMPHVWQLFGTKFYLLLNDDFTKSLIVTSYDVRTTKPYSADEISRGINFMA